MDKEGRFFNRELSWVEFNIRVMDQADRGDTPLMERLRFLAIYANNLDEFMMVRAAGIRSQVLSGLKRRDPSGRTPAEVLEALASRLQEQHRRLYAIYRRLEEDLPASSGVNLVSPGALGAEEVSQLRDIYQREYESLLTPMGLDVSRPFPFTQGKALFLMIRIAAEEGAAPASGGPHYAVIPVPTGPRLIPLPGRRGTYILLEQLIRLFCGSLFRGYRVEETAVFRVSRDADLDIREEEVADLLSALEDQIRQRERGDVIRLETSSDIPPDMLEILQGQLPFQDPRFHFSAEGPLDLTFLFELSGPPEQHYAPLPPVLPAWFDEQRQPGELFSVLEEQDRWIHRPFHSFEPVTALIEEAAADPGVLAVKMTLYRTSGRSRIIQALQKAAAGGKQVTVLVELKARFDEAQNITWAKELERAGCHVVYGLVGMKIHAKMTLIIRRTPDGIRRYVHLSTGNYNENTAKVYTDIGLFTARRRFGKEAGEIFNVLTGFSEPPRWKNLVCSPLDLRDYTQSLIDREIENARQGQPAQIWAKMNSLIDCRIIEKLYEASGAGVQIQLLVRGMCRLVPGRKGLSANITVRSIVGRFLEHSRIYWFSNNGEGALYLSSADWMERNLDRRVEVLFPVKDPAMRAELSQYMCLYDRDSLDAYRLKPDGRYETERKGHRAQQEIYEAVERQHVQGIQERRAFRVAGQSGPSEAQAGGGAQRAEDKRISPFSRKGRIQP